MRTTAQQIAAFKARVDKLFANESRCPACKEAARLAEDTLNPKICIEHQILRNRIALQGMRTWSATPANKK